MGSLAIDLEAKAYLAIGVTPELKKYALNELSGMFDIRSMMLLPDLDGFGYANSARFDNYESERW
jgi:hypothetical protein